MFTYCQLWISVLCVRNGTDELTEWRRRYVDAHIYQYRNLLGLGDSSGVRVGQSYSARTLWRFLGDDDWIFNACRCQRLHFLSWPLEEKHRLELTTSRPPKHRL